MTKRLPLLSICVPTYNRADFLRVMLQAVLPQVAESDGKVEVWVLDNASTDDTQRVVEESRELSPFRSVVNERNEGAVKNMINGCCKFATGEYVWILGHHSLMAPGALKKVVTALESNAELDVFYANFRCANFPNQWPQSSFGGYDGAFQYVGNKKTIDRMVTKWSELLDAKSALCTQVYAHIVRRRIWKEYWADKEIGQVYQDSTTTYPHTHMLADVAFKKPTLYIGTPAITIFNGAQSWGAPKTQCEVYLRGLPNLLCLFARKGLPKKDLQEFKKVFAVPETTRILKTALPHFGVMRLIFEVARSCPLAGYVWLSLVKAFIDSECNTASRLMKKAERSIQGRRNWWIVNCRFARWIRSQIGQ